MSEVNAYEPQFLARATIFLGVVAAISTAVQAWIAYEERYTPFRAAIFDRQIAALISIEDSANKICDGRRCFANPQSEQKMCLAPLDEEKNRMNLELDKFVLVSNAAAIGNATILVQRLAGLLIIDKLDKVVEAKSYKDDWERQQAYIASCRKDIHQFVSASRDMMGLNKPPNDLAQRFQAMSR